MKTIVENKRDHIIAAPVIPCSYPEKHALMPDSFNSEVKEIYVLSVVSVYFEAR
jgi:hypothetical protein